MAAKRQKRQAGCYWRGNTIWGRTFIKGRECRWSLQTSDPKIAAKRRAAGKERAIADLHGDGSAILCRSSGVMVAVDREASQPEDDKALCLFARSIGAIP